MEILNSIEITEHFERLNSPMAITILSSLPPSFSLALVI